MAVCEPGPMAPVNKELVGGEMSTYNPNPHTLSWERLEKRRLRSLGMPNRFSRHFNLYTQNNVNKTVYRPPITPTFEQSLRASLQPVVTKQTTPKQGVSGISKPNSLAPFYTLGKPTCGFFFSRETDNKKRDFGIPPSDLVAWRSFVLQ